MPHPRKRYIAEIIRKKLKFSPVVTIQGARQTGKSFFVKNILKQEHQGLKYLTFDKSSDRDFASTNPDTFLEQYSEAEPLAIDEAQKVPGIFDAIKFSVDENRKPGKYLLLGSTEFSKLHKIRESLTGRISRARLFPLTLTESLNKPITKVRAPFFIGSETTCSRTELMRYLDNGGFPGIFSIHNSSERRLAVSDWLDLTTERDVHQFQGAKLESALCQRLLKGIATLDTPDQASLVRYCRRDSRVVKRHLEALLTLFVINELAPFPGGTGKPIYFLCDVSIATFLGANFKRQLYTWAITELFSKCAYLEDHKRSYSYYRNSKGSMIELIEENGDTLSALKIHDEEKVTSKDFYLLNSIKEKFKISKILLLGSDFQKWKEYGVDVVPWESLA